MPPLIQAVTVNEVQIVNLGVADLIAQQRAGKPKSLSSTDRPRSPLLPDIPTFPEAGIPGIGFVGWIGFAGPAGIPKNSVTRVYAQVAKIGTSDAYREKFIVNLGMTPAPITRRSSHDSSSRTANWPWIMSGSQGCGWSNNAGFDTRREEF